MGRTDDSVKYSLAYLAGSVGALALIAAVLLGGFAFSIWLENKYKTRLQALEVPGRGVQFVLMTDIGGVGDRAWYVYELPAGAALSKSMKTGSDREGVLFRNYSEGGDHSEDAKIEVLKEKYLVFSRGGFYHSLYDMERKEVLVNDESPWHSFMESVEDRTLEAHAPDSEVMRSGMDAWVRKNLHSKIADILAKAP